MFPSFQHIGIPTFAGASIEGKGEGAPTVFLRFQITTMVVFSVSTLLGIWPTVNPVEVVSQ